MPLATGPLSKLTIRPCIAANHRSQPCSQCRYRARTQNDARMIDRSNKMRTRFRLNNSIDCCFLSDPPSSVFVYSLLPFCALHRTQLCVKKNEMRQLLAGYKSRTAHTHAHSLNHLCGRRRASLSTIFFDANRTRCRHWVAASIAYMK